MKKQLPKMFSSKGENRMSEKMKQILFSILAISLGILFHYCDAHASPVQAPQGVVDTTTKIIASSPDSVVVERITKNYVYVDTLWGCCGIETTDTSDMIQFPISTQVDTVVYYREEKKCSHKGYDSCSSCVPQSPCYDVDTARILDTTFQNPFLFITDGNLVIEMINLFPNKLDTVVECSEYLLVPFDSCITWNTYGFPMDSIRTIRLCDTTITEKGE